MKQMKRLLLATAVCLLMACVLFAGSALAVSADDFTVDSNGVLTKWTGSDANLVIPSNLGITSIGDNVFNGKTALQSVTIPSGVTSINYRAFYGCTGLQTVSMPTTLTTIGRYAFYNCDGLQSVAIPSSVKTIDQNAFYDCNGLRTLSLSGSNLTTIGYEAFAYCTALKAVVLPSSVKKIDGAGFANCTSLTTLKLSSSLTTMGDSAFRETGVASVTIPGSLETVPYSAFRNCDSLTTVTIDSGVTSIANYAFYDCDKLTTVSIPSTVTAIGQDAFYSCASLTNVGISEGVASIGYEAFAYCPALKTITIPSSVKTIDGAGFAYCTNLATVTLNNGLTSLGDSAFRETSIASIAIPGSLKTVPYSAFRNCDLLKTVTINSGVTSIANYAFYDCDKLEAVSIPSSVTSIGQYVFYSCDSLTTVNIPGSVTSIGYEAFRYCSALETITVPQSVTSFGSGIFGGCSALTVKVYEGSYAHNYCVNNSYKHEIIPVPPEIYYVEYVTAMQADGSSKVTFTVCTDSTAASVKMFSEDGTVIRTCTPSDVTVETSDGLRFWTISQVFNVDGVRTIGFSAATDKSAFCDVFYWDGEIICAKVTSAAFSPTSIMVGDKAYATVKTTLGANYLGMYTETGAQAKKWDAATYSTVSGSVRTWKIDYTFNGAGSRKFTFKASNNGSTFTTGSKTAALTVASSAPTIQSVTASQTLQSDGSAMIQYIVKTSTSAAKVNVYVESGSLLKTCTTANTTYADSGSTRTWTIKQALTAGGARTLSFKAVNSSGTASSAVACKVNVVCTQVTSAAFSPATITAGGKTTATVKTGSGAQYLSMYTETGSLVKTWKAASYSTVSGTTRTWTLSNTFSGVGNRKFTFKASVDGNTYNTGKAAALTVTKGLDYAVTSAVFSPNSVTTGKSAMAAVKTGADAKYLTMYAENGGKVKTWDAATYSAVSGSVRTWTVSYAFAAAGSRQLTFKASADGTTYGAGKTAALTVIKGLDYAVTSAVFSPNSVAAGTNAMAAVKTGADAKYLTMYTENGGKVKTWDAATYSVVSGSVRTWTVRYAFAAAGSRQLTFKASADGTTYGTGKTAALTVTKVLDYAVTSAVFSPASAAAGTSAKAVVKTGADAKYLTMYAENGGKVKTWNASSYSTVSGNVRTWSISYAFASAGSRQLTFKASADGTTYGTGKTAALSVYTAASVTSACFIPASIKLGDSVTAIVETSSSAKYLHMYTETGSVVKKWDAASYSSVSGNVRTWIVTYTFGGAGNRVMTFKASTDGTTTGAGKTASLTITK